MATTFNGKKRRPSEIVRHCKCGVRVKVWEFVAKIAMRTFELTVLCPSCADRLKKEHGISTD